MTRAKRLLELQEIDLQQDDLRARLARVAAALRDDRVVVTARTALAEAEADLTDVEHRLRQQTLAREPASAHVTREEQHLYSGRVKGAKELQNLEREVAALKRQLDHLDDVVLELMILRDEAADRVARARTALTDADTATASQRDALTRKQRALTGELRRLDGEREAVVATVPPAERELYEQLRQAKAGRAVSDLRDGACGACGMQLPNQDVVHIRSGDQHVFCRTCGRIVLG